MGSVSTIGNTSGRSEQAALASHKPSATFPSPWKSTQSVPSAALVAACEQPAPTSLSNSDAIKIHKIRKAASEFEGLLLSNWWRTMKESGWADDGDDADPAKDTLDQMGIQAVSQAVADGGGFGIAKMLVRSLLKTMQMEEASSAEKTAHKASI